jgi:CRP-like cAMP-binding protein
MIYDSILRNVARHVTLRPEEADHFKSLLRHREVPRKEFLLKAGQTAKHISFIHSGALKAYYLDASSVENIIMLFNGEACHAVYKCDRRQRGLSITPK